MPSRDSRQNNEGAQGRDPAVPIGASRQESRQFRSEYFNDPQQVKELGYRELVDLILSPEFEARYVKVHTSAEVVEVARWQQLIDGKLIFPLKVKSVDPEFEGFSQVTRDRKKYLMTLARAVPTLMLEERSYDLKLESDLITLRQKLVRADGRYEQGYQQQLEELDKARSAAQHQVARLRDELTSVDTDRLQNALEVWGRTRNSLGNTNDGLGFNAGVIHYFEYRAFTGKNRRFQLGDLKECSLENFIKLSEYFSTLLRNESVDAVGGDSSRVTFEDFEGRQRVFLRTAELLLVGFKHPHQPLRLLSFLPNKTNGRGHEDQQQEAMVIKELADTEFDTRFNRLGINRQVAK